MKKIKKGEGKPSPALDLHCTSGKSHLNAKAIN